MYLFIFNFYKYFNDVSVPKFFRWKKFNHKKCKGLNTKIQTFRKFLFLCFCLVNINHRFLLITSPPSDYEILLLKEIYHKKFYEFLYS